MSFHESRKSLKCKQGEFSGFGHPPADLLRGVLDLWPVGCQVVASGYHGAVRPLFLRPQFHISFHLLTGRLNPGRAY